MVLGGAQPAGLTCLLSPCSFVSGIVELYYKNNLCVQRDYELQAWICDIFTKGFLSKRSSGNPTSWGNAQQEHSSARFSRGQHLLQPRPLSLLA